MVFFSLLPLLKVCLEECLVCCTAVLVSVVKSGGMMGHMAATRHAGGYGDFVGEDLGGGEELDWNGL